MIIVTALATLLGGCGTPSDELSGSVLLWHSWGEEQAAVLNQAIENFHTLHPGVSVRVAAVAPDNLRTRYEEAARFGLGPDLLLGSSEWIQPLADAGLIRPLAEQEDDDFWNRYMAAAANAVRYRGRAYALPESLRVMGLYYRRDQLEAPAQTLDELLTAADAGLTLGLSPTFADAFWGLQAFGGQLFDEEERTVLDRGGFANWLTWLKTAQESPNVLIDRDRPTLTDLFLQGEVAYLVDGSWEFLALRSALGDEKLGVTTLPDGPVGPAGPLLDVDAFLFNQASSARQHHLALVLATFLTNAEQQAIFMRRAGRIPTNVRVRVNPGVDPVAFTFQAQARNAIPRSNSHAMERVLQLGDDAYNRVLQGVQEPLAAAQELTVAINEANGFAAPIAAVDDCGAAGNLLLWHSMGNGVAASLDRIAADFSRICTNATVTVAGFSHEEMFNRLRERVSSLEADLLLIPNDWLVALSSSDIIRDWNGLNNTDLLQQLHPRGLDTMRIGDRLWGAPFELAPQALYYNKLLVAEPAQTLSDMMAQGESGLGTVLTITFDQAYWGIPAFGGQLFDDEGRAVLDQGGFAEWLAWLQEAQRGAGLMLVTNPDAAQRAFLMSDAHYLVDDPRALAALERQMGATTVGVAALPTGPVANALALLKTTGFVLSRDLDEAQTQLALHFIRYATNLENQTRLISEARLVPANIGVDISANPLLAVFMEQVNTAIVYPNRPQMTAVIKPVDRAYARLLEGEEGGPFDPTQIARDTTDLINRANGFTAIPTEEASDNEAAE